jgi:hypothetical protein
VDRRRHEGRLETDISVREQVTNRSGAALPRDRLQGPTKSRDFR